VSLTVWRDGHETSLQVESGKAPETVTSENEEQAPAVSPSAGETKVPALGLTLGRLTNDARQELGLKKDVKGALVTDVEDGKAAADRDIRPGDVIVKVGDQAVTSPGEAAQKVEQAQKANQRAVLLLLKRRGEERFVALPFARASG
jgi:serine protease Do